VRAQIGFARAHARAGAVTVARTAYLDAATLARAFHDDGALREITREAATLEHRPS
jgi:hypothetical protein